MASAVDYDQFVIAWRDSNSIDEVCQKLGRTRASVEHMRSKLRKAKVFLKEMPKPQNSPRLNPEEVERLSKLSRGEG